MSALTTWLVAGLVIVLLVVVSKLIEAREREKRLQKSLEDGRDHSERRRKFEFVLLDALEGDPVAQAMLGKEYYYGGMVGQNYTKARKWLEAAAKQGHPDAACDLGCVFFLGNGVAKDTETAISWFEKASQSGSARAHLLLGRAYNENVESLAKAVNHYDIAAKMGIHAAKFELAQLCLSGRGIPQDSIRAIDLLEQASTNRDDPQTANEAEKLLEQIKTVLTPEEMNLGKTRSRSWESAFAPAAMLEFAAEDGDVIAQYILANSYWLGVVNFWHPDTKAEMLKWYEKASEQGYSMAQYELGWHYLEGKHWHKDVSRAVDLLRAAAQQGNPCAQEELGMIYFKDVDVPADFPQACKWLLICGAEGSEPKAALNEIRSRLAPEQIAQAEAAAKNFSANQNPLDDLRRVALFEFEKSSQQMFQLRMEANNGNTDAQFELGSAYWKNQNCAGSRAMAYVWLSLATAGGHLLAGKLRDTVAPTLPKRVLLLAQLVSREKIPAGDISLN